MVSQIGGTGSDGGDGVAAGPGGDAFVIGDSNGATRFSPRVELSPTAGATRGSRATAPTACWPGRSRSGARASSRATESAPTRDGRTLVTGEHRGGTRFGTTVLASDRAQSDAFVARLGRRGRVLWAQRFGGPGVDLGRGVDADADGHVHLSGEFSGTIRLGATTLISAGGRDSFVATGGRVVWAKGMGGPGDEVGPEIEVDARGAVHLVGTFQGQARFGDRTLTASGAQAAFRGAAYVPRPLHLGRPVRPGPLHHARRAGDRWREGQRARPLRRPGHARALPATGAGRTDAFGARLPTR